MNALVIALFAIIGSTIVVDAQLRQSHNPIDSGKKVVCVYNSTCNTREGQYFILFIYLSVEKINKRFGREERSQQNTKKIPGSLLRLQID